MDSLNQVKTDVVQLISENSSIGVVMSGKQDLDILAAALSLHLLFQDSGKNSQVVSPKEPTVEHSFLVGIDQLVKNFSGQTKTLTVSFPYHDGDIEKVSYNIEGDRLNVNLFAEEAGIRFTEKDIKYIRQGTNPQLIFTLGVSQIAEIQEISGQAAKIVNIDNNVANGMFGQVNIVDPSYSSLSEIIAKIAQDLSLQMEFDVAQNLLDGITFATQNFSSPKTSPLAFEMAGFLMQKGAVRKDVQKTRPPVDTSLQMLGKSQDNQKLSQQSQPFNSAKFNKPFSDQSFTSSSSQPRHQPEEFRQRSQQPQSMPNPQVDLSSSDSIPELPSEDQAPSDWFTPKVFKSNKNQG